MTVNHDVVGSSPTGGVIKRSLERFFVFLGLFTRIFQSFFSSIFTSFHCFKFVQLKIFTL